MQAATPNGRLNEEIIVAVSTPVSVASSAASITVPATINAAGRDGKKIGSRTWKPTENIFLIKIIERLSLTVDIPDTDKRWKTVCEDILKQFQGVLRSNAAVRDHFRDMVAQVRAVSMSFSSHATAIVRASNVLLLVQKLSER